MKPSCIDPVVGGILAGWRYDISGIAPDMRVDYEGHLVTCTYCRKRQRLHRRIDISLVVLTSAAAAVFAAAFVVERLFASRHALIFQVGALLGCAISALLAVLVAISTPAPLVITDAALEGARRVHDRLPENIRSRIPEELRLKLAELPGRAGPR